MTLKAGRMTRCSCRDRKSDSSIRRLMTCRTACLSNMSTVIEDCVKALQRRESLYVRRRVTDRTDRTRIPLREFSRVTRSTRNVSRHFRSRAVVASNMADETRHSRVLLRVMSKFRKVLSRLVCVIVRGCGSWSAGIRENDHETEYEQRSADRYRPRQHFSFFVSVCHVYGLPPASMIA